MSVKGDKWRGGWNREYESNFDKIFRKEKMSTTPEQYLEMWLSEQIPTSEWMRLLEWRPDIKEVYEKHLEEKKK
tara:strand:- start:344 stop:565 length:222 start_codon:yes stop_codon:yes gene_type:complete